MNQPNSYTTEIAHAISERHIKNSRAITISFSITAFAASLYLGYFAYTEYLANNNGVASLLLLSMMLFGTIFANFYPLSLIRKGQSDFAMIALVSIFLFDVIALELFIQGLGLIISLTTILLFLFVAGLAMSSRYAVAGTVLALVAGIVTLALDYVVTYERIQIPLLVEYAPYIASGLIIPILFIFIFEFRNFNFQIKTSLGIFITGGIIVTTVAYFGITRAGEIVNSLSEKFEASVTTKTENEILSSVQTEASKADLLFSSIQESLINLAEYHSNLEDKKSSFLQNNYWNSAERIFQLPNGQFGNSRTDTASIFIPNTVLVDEEMLADIDTSIYLDFLAPNLLQANPQIVALYYISATGYTIYYPNTNLAQNVPPDFDPRTESFYTIASPQRNPDSLPQWTNPYQDPAGTGPIVTLSVPVHNDSGEFTGVVGADITLSSISNFISEIQLADTDFAFVVDENGFIISMPEQGYQVFGLEEREFSSNPTLRQSIFDTQSEILQFAAQRIIINQTNLLDIPINGVDTYFAVANLPTTQYKLVFFAPTDELNAEILNSRQEVQSEIQNALQNASLILIGLFISALVISLLVGQVIIQPIRRLTNTVEEITSGNLNARAEVQTHDEAGVLAYSFNEMTERLNSTLQGLEEKVAERTSELEIISQSNAKRATQFESIARISHIISSTQTLDKLLPQIVENISEEFGFYHVGIFLLDAHKEFAVLAAANSEGGKRMLERNHRLRVGETGIVGFVTRAGQPRIALDVGTDAVFFNNPDLPNTRSEIALPLRIQAEIFGALDVQSRETNAFTEEDINILSVLADQVSIAIQNARSYQQSREALEQAEISAAQMIEQQWNQFLNRQNVTHYHFDGVEARQFTNVDEETHNLAIPLILRGARIGTLRLSTTDPNKAWDEDEIAIAQATAERTALAIENARLLQEAQKRAAKEKTIADVSAKIGNLISLETILEATIQQLGNTLPNTEVAIQFTDLPEQK